MQFEFSTASRIIFGPGKLDIIGGLVAEISKNVMIISGCPQATADRLIRLLEAYEITSSYIKIKSEPTTDLILELVEFCRQSRSEVVIGIGGGSAIDSAKATAALVTNAGDISDYLEVIGRNQPLINPPLALIAIPTTAGTGSEVTRNAVLGSPLHHIKVSLRGPHLLPLIALVDPELTITVPPLITAYTGLDTLTQLIEPFTCNSPNPLTDAICQEGIKRVGGSLYRAHENGSNLNAREDMALASLFSGLALANSKLGAVHGLAGPLGGEISAPHGAICARLLPPVMEANRSALLRLAADHPALEKYRIIAVLLTGNKNAGIEEGIQWVRDFCQHVGIPHLSTYGLIENMFDAVLAKATYSSSMKGNPVILSEGELRNILQQSL